MKKISYLVVSVILVFLLAACGNNQASKPDNAEQAPSGEAAMASDDKPEDTPETSSDRAVKIRREFMSGKTLTDETEYDINGNKIKDYVCETGDEDYGHEYEYDADGHLIKDENYDDGAVAMWTEYEYDASGFLTRAKGFWSNGNSAFTLAYETDPAGNVVREYYYTLNSSKVNHWQEYEYDAEGNKTKGTFHPNDGDYIESWTEYEYNAARKLVTEKNYNYDGAMFSSTEYEYDIAGLLIKRTDYKSNGEVHYWYSYEYEFYD